MLEKSNNLIKPLIEKVFIIIIVIWLEHIQTLLEYYLLASVNIYSNLLYFWKKILLKWLNGICKGG